MSKAVLLAGDSDFRPLVESLVRLGTYVQLAYENKTVAKELAKATDAESEINLTTLCRWAKLPNYVNRDHHFPLTITYRNHDHDPGPNMTNSRRLSSGLIGSAKINLYLVNELYIAFVEIVPRDFVLYQFADQQKLLAYLTQIYGEINWRT
jgi:hypothetical protein